MQVTREFERGQTLPFWAIGTMLVLTLLFFLANYVGAVSWQIHAQNAADSAASAVLSVQANVWNEESTILYTAAVDENRVRYLNQAILNTISGAGACDPTPGSTCDQDYQSLVNEYNVALNGFTTDVQLIGQADQLSEGGQQTDERKTLSAFGTNCGQSGGGVDCSFAYTALDTSQVPTNGKGKNQFAPNRVDLVACRNVAYFVPQLLSFASNASYKAVARAAAAVIPANSEAFDPGTQINPATGQAYQPQEPQWASAFQAPLYTVDFSSLTVHLNWYTAAGVHPYSGTISGGYQCL
jgi:Putative Flp pilus-assembly TadE/G-like